MLSSSVLKINIRLNTILALKNVSKNAEKKALKKSTKKNLFYNYNFKTKSILSILII